MTPDPQSLPPADDATGAAPRRRHRRVVRRGTEREVVPGVTADERGDTWGEAAPSGTEQHGSNDARLRQDVPPHWGRGA